MGYKQEGVKQLTLRCSESEEALIAKLKEETNCSSATKALISAGSNYLVQKKRIKELELTIQKQEQKIKMLKNNMEEYNDFFSLLKKMTERVK